ncbi:glycosyltransferase [Lactococcus lactis]|uniref:glycosyltransferase n=1 Tax=Lactococcus lactis TaxID=1358 RepID=UPI0028923DFA|nr:glycosyltransferase [Lactococcus lactis]MDT2877632.1 glycosyltransferase [Lactococcus lactis]
MKILIIDTVPFLRNGISTVIMNYYDILRKNSSIEFVINKLIDLDYKKHIESTGGKIYNFGSRNRNPIHYSCKLRELIKKEKYDVVYIHGNSSTLAVELFSARNLQIPKVVHAHNVVTDHPFIDKVLKKYFLNHYDIGFAASEDAGKFLFKQHEFKVIPNGINLANFYFDAKKRKKIREKFNVTDSTKLILQVGTFTRQKNHEFSLKLLTSIRYENIKFVFVGEGELLNEIRTKVEEKDLSRNVIFQASTDDINGYFSAADAVILPSLWEGLPLVGIEAQAAAVPLAVSNEIDKRLDICNTINFFPLEVETWKKWILETLTIDSERDIDKNHDDIKFAGYDIHQNAYHMELYLKKLI